jgi:hypothetical protein
MEGYYHLHNLLLLPQTRPNMVLTLPNGELLLILLLPLQQKLAAALLPTRKFANDAQIAKGIIESGSVKEKNRCASKLPSPPRR